MERLNVYKCEICGMGVNATCATCDAPLYADKKTAVIGGGDSGGSLVAQGPPEDIAKNSTSITGQYLTL